MKLTKKQIENEVIRMEEKYFDLVWFARRSEEAMLILSDNGVGPNHIAVEQVKRIASLFPKETQKLMQAQDNWDHGFNSGMLAGMRYVITLIEDGQEIAEEEFPFLDT